MKLNNLNIYYHIDRFLCYCFHNKPLKFIHILTSMIHCTITCIALRLYLTTKLFDLLQFVCFNSYFYFINDMTHNEIFSFYNIHHILAIRVIFEFYKDIDCYHLALVYMNLEISNYPMYFTQLVAIDKSRKKTLLYKFLIFLQAFVYFKYRVYNSLYYIKFFEGTTIYYYLVVILLGGYWWTFLLFKKCLNILVEFYPPPKLLG